MSKESIHFYLPHQTLLWLTLFSPTMVETSGQEQYLTSFLLTWLWRREPQTTDLSKRERKREKKSVPRWNLWMRVLWLQNVPIIVLSHHKAAVQLQRGLFPMHRSLASVPACQRQYTVRRGGHLQAATLLSSESGPNLNLSVPVTLEIIPSAQFQGQDTHGCPEVQIKHISGA